MTENTNRIINSLEKLDESKEIFEEKNKNQTVCRLLNIQLGELFDDIYIPFKFFREEEWNISKVLYNNEDALFYNKKYLTDEDEERFHQVFSKYLTMLEDIFSPDNKLQFFLRKWTDMSEMKWKTNDTKSYLKTIITCRKYQYISPSYTTNLYCEYGKKFNNDNEKIKIELEKHLDLIVKKIKQEIRDFKNQYQEIVDAYVYEYTDEIDHNYYVLGFINSIILAILDFAEKLIEMKVYAIHPFIKDIIEYYTPLDEINQYDPSENDGKKIRIV